MTRQRVQQSLIMLCIGLLNITSFSVSAQEFPEPEDGTERIVVTGTRRITYVAPGTDSETTDIYTLELLDQAGIFDHDDDPTTPRVIEEGGYEVTNITNTPGINEIDPQFSWGGSLILYGGEADPTTYPGVNSLFVVNSNGQNNVQITPNGVNVLNATFNPDGTQVAFSAQWGSSQFKIYRSDLDGGNQYTLTPGEGFNAAFPLWSMNANGTDEILYIRAEGGTSQVHRLDPLRATTQPVTNTPNQKFILDPLDPNRLYTLIQHEDSESDWEVAILNSDTGEITPLTDNTTNDCCAVAVWSMDGVVETDMTALGSSPVYYLSDTEDGGRDIYSVNLDGSNPVNLTANDDREYTGVLSSSLFLELAAFDERPSLSSARFGRFHSPTLLVGYNEIEGDRTVPRLGFTWNISSRESAGDYELLFLTNGSDPDVVDPISLEQLEALAADGLLTTVCEYIASPLLEGGNIIARSEPDNDAPVMRSLHEGDSVSVDGMDHSGDWLHTTDGDWISHNSLQTINPCQLPVIITG